MKEYGYNTIGIGAEIFEPVTIGFPSVANIDKLGYVGAVIGKNARIRSGTVIYCDVSIGDQFQTGHNVIIREKTKIGDRVAVGTASVIEGNTTIGNDVSLQSMVYLPTGTVIGKRVFIGPGTVLTNDKYPPGRDGKLLSAPEIEDDVAIGGHATILPGVVLGEGSFVAAGAIVTKDVPEYMMAIGAPAKIMALPDKMRKK